MQVAMRGARWVKSSPLTPNQPVSAEPRAGGGGGGGAQGLIISECLQPAGQRRAQGCSSGKSTGVD